MTFCLSALLLGAASCDDAQTRLSSSGRAEAHDIAAAAPATAAATAPAIVALSPIGGADVIDGAEVSASSPRGSVFSDALRSGGRGPEMVVVPAGVFTMGSSPAEDGHFDDEGPQHGVTISRPFAVGRFEVTRGSYAEFVRATGRATRPSCFADRDGDRDQYQDRTASWRDPAYDQDDEHPVVCVSWDDAQAYVRWLSRETGQSYRLLTEAEWEYALRGETELGAYSRFHFGDRANDLCRYANVADQTAQRTHASWSISDCDDGYLHTSPVGSYESNAFGLYDMHGNVWEWVEDCFVNTYERAPADGAAVSRGGCLQRVLRGASWFYGSRGLRSAARGRFTPSLRVNHLGFRLARDFD